MKKYIIMGVLICAAFAARVIAMNIMPEQEIINMSRSKRGYTQKQLVEEADVIVIGTVKEVLPARCLEAQKTEEYPDLQPQLGTQIVVTVKELIKGTLTNERQVVVLTRVGVMIT